MVGRFFRLAAAAAFCASLAACASAPDENFSSAYGHVDRSGPAQQCVPYARARSGIALYGDAWTWWDQAAGKFEREAEPRLGAIMVLAGYAGPKRAHLAVVRAMDSERQIRVDHANWLNDGSILTDDPVLDVSGDNDWSAVKVWNPRTGAWGSKVYAVQGFIGPDRDPGMVASAGF